MADDEAGERGELRELVSQIRTHLATRQRSGLPRPAHAQRAAPARRPRPPRRAPVLAGRPRQLGAARRGRDGRARPRGAACLALVREELVTASAAKLAPLRTKLVFGVGQPERAPGVRRRGACADEDAQGEAFVGQGRPVLTKMIEAMGLRARGRSTSATSSSAARPATATPSPTRSRSRALPEGASWPRCAAIIVALGKFAAQCPAARRHPDLALARAFPLVEGIQLMPRSTRLPASRSFEEEGGLEDLKAVNAALNAWALTPRKRPRDDCDL